MTVVKLEEVRDNIITVSGLDFIDGTPVLDIKPYYENDVIFSPGTPYIKPAELKMMENILMVQARNHHREECLELYLGVKMSLWVERELGKLTNEDITVTVKGSACLGDVIQGITKARIANPRRFFFIEDAGQAITVWQKGKRIISIKLKTQASLDEIKTLPGEQFLDISDNQE